MEAGKAHYLMSALQTRGGGAVLTQFPTGILG